MGSDKDDLSAPHANLAVHQRTGVETGTAVQFCSHQIYQARKIPFRHGWGRESKYLIGSVFLFMM